MGILDEAIRQHLELKRTRGADPAEVTRQEQEALGPVRREPAAGAEPGDGEALTEVVAPEPGPSEAEASHLAAETPEAVAPELAPEPEPAPPEASPSVGAIADPDVSEEWGFEPEEDPSPEPAAAAEEEDVLEETPEFLQETPEHDRLWFEQKPPRDFDFDG